MVQRHGRVYRGGAAARLRTVLYDNNDIAVTMVTFSLCGLSVVQSAQELRQRTIRFQVV